MTSHGTFRWCVVILAWVAAGGIRPAEVRAQCSSWGSATNLSNATGRYAVDAHMAIDGSGKVHIVYQNFLDASGANYYVTNAGGSWSAPQLVSNMGGKGSAPKIVLTPDNVLHIFAGKGGIYEHTKPLVGGSWSAGTLVDAFGSGNFLNHVVVDSTGGIYMMYGHLFDGGAPARNGIYGRYKPLGGGWSANELIYGNSSDSNWPGGCHLAAQGTTLWMAMELDDRVYFKKKTAGGSWSPGGKGTQFHGEGGALRFAFHPNGTTVAGIFSYTVDDGENTPWYEIFAKYSNDGGASWTAEESISNYLIDIDRSPQATYDANGNLHVLWEGFCCDHKLRIRYRSKIGGAWGPIVNLTPSNVSGLSTDAIKNIGNQLLATYTMTGSGMVGLYDVFFSSTGTPAQPMINLNAAAFSRSMWIRTTLSNNSFTIGNGCVGTLNYTVTDNRDWIQVAPGSGSSVLDVDTITVSYNGVNLLNRGTHTGTITITGNAWNTPQTINVSVTVNTVKPDFDGDADVDMDDFSHLQGCLTGVAIEQTDPACLDARLDYDGSYNGDKDVDENDLNLFLGCMSGAGIPAVQNCMP